MGSWGVRVDKWVGLGQEPRECFPKWQLSCDLKVGEGGNSTAERGNSKALSQILLRNVFGSRKKEL